VKQQVKKDLHDGDPWSEMAVRDLRDALGQGDSIEKAAEFLCRSGTLNDVRRKADELGLTYHSGSSAS
jgi:hypothetical protein